MTKPPSPWLCHGRWTVHPQIVVMEIWMMVMILMMMILMMILMMIMMMMMILMMIMIIRMIAILLLVLLLVLALYIYNIKSISIIKLLFFQYNNNNMIFNKDRSASQKLSF